MDAPEIWLAGSCLRRDCGTVRCNTGGSPFGVAARVPVLEVVATESPEDLVVVDVGTGLIWQRTINANVTYDWEAAVAVCARRVYGLLQDWRLPDRYELQSLVDDPRAPPAQDPERSPDVPEGARYWTTSTYRGDTDLAVAVQWDTGALAGAVRADELQVRCVREDVPGARTRPRPRYEEVGDGEEGVVQDLMTGLEWQISPPRPGAFWDADKACGNDEWAGRGDWRQPSVQELSGLYDDRSVTGVNMLTGEVRLDPYGTRANPASRHLLCVRTPPAAGDVDCAIADDFVPCNDYDGDSVHDVCLSGRCESRGCGDFRCNSGGPIALLPAFDARDIARQETDVEGETVVADVDAELMWQTASAAQWFWADWWDATRRCKESSYGGFDDWRRPDRYELLSIVDRSQTEPAFDEEMFGPLPDPPLDFTVAYWTDSRFDIAAQTVEFRTGALVKRHDPGFAHARCVRLTNPEGQRRSRPRFERVGDPDADGRGRLKILTSPVTRRLPPPATLADRWSV